MRVERLQVDDPRWTSALATLAYDVYHLPAWSRASGVIDGGEPSAVLVQDGEHQVLVPMIVRPIPGDAEHFDATSPYGYASPSRSRGTPDAVVDEALAVAGEHLRGERVIAWFLRLHPLFDEAWRPAVGTTVEHGQTVSIDLHPSHEDYRKGLRGSHRREIDRAQREGVQVHRDRDLVHLDGFIALYLSTMRRVGAHPYYLFPDEYFRQLAILGEHLQLWVALYEGELIAAAMVGVVRQSGIMQYHLSAADPEHRNRYPTKFLLDRIRAWGAREGLSRFHLGGGLGGRDDELLRFKGGFSPDRHLFRTLRIVVDHRAYDRLCRSAGRTPDDGTGFFPAYRIPTST
jgi:CelD/BcsL family acetyltransferase involved in cellulose biosynthesis